MSITSVIEIVHSKLFRDSTEYQSYYSKGIHVSNCWVHSVCMHVALYCFGLFPGIQ